MENVNLTQQEQMEAAVAISALTNVLAKKCALETTVFAACEKTNCDDEMEKLQRCTKDV